jgi:hypothetical protein
VVAGVARQSAEAHGPAPMDPAHGPCQRLITHPKVQHHALEERTGHPLHRRYAARQSLRFIRSGALSGSWGQTTWPVFIIGKAGAGSCRMVPIAVVARPARRCVLLVFGRGAQLSQMRASLRAMARYLGQRPAPAWCVPDHPDARYFILAFAGARRVVAWMTRGFARCGGSLAARGLA